MLDNEWKLELYDEMKSLKVSDPLIPLEKKLSYTKSKFEAWKQKYNGWIQNIYDLLPS